MSHIEKEKLIKADIDSIENRIRHAFNQGYDLGYKEGKANCSKNSTGPTTKNDLGVDREDAVIRLNALKQFIGYDKDSEIVKATQKSLDMAISALEHPERNVVAIVPCGDAISRSDVLKLMQDNWHTHNGDWAMQESMDDIRALPSVTPQEPRWIPVSEYLPVTNDEVLVTYIVNGNAKKRYVETANCFDGEWSSVNDEYRIPNTKIEIIAWCEMPKPYKAEIEPQESEG